MSKSAGGRMRGLALATAVAVGGCAMHPYVPFASLSVAGKEEITLGVAIDYANSARTQYEKALIAEAERRSIVANGLIVLGSAVLGMAALNAHRDALVVTSLLGGTVYTLGTWNESRPREQIYVEGMKAMSCAIDAVMPLNISRTDRQAIDHELAMLVKQIAQLNQDIAVVENLAVSGDVNAKPDPALLAAAQADVATARLLTKTADETYVAGQRLQHEIGRAGLQLINTVNMIGSHVAGALRGTLADLGRLPEVIRGLSQASEIFAPGLGLADTLASRMGSRAGDPDAGKGDVQLQRSQTAKQVAERNLRAALGRLKTSALQIASQTRRISLLVEGINAGRPIEKLKSCGVQVDLDIRISPAQLVFIEKQAGEKRVTISGGKKPYSAVLLDTPAPIEVRPPFIGDSTFTIVATDKTVAGGMYTVHVSDASEHTKQVTVVIQAASSSADPKPIAAKPPANAPNNAPEAPVGVTRSPEIQQIQQALCIPVDGIYGEQTKLAIEIFEDQTGTPVAEIDGVLTAEQLQKVKALPGSCDKGRMNSVEKELNADEIRGLRTKVGLNDGKDLLDKAFRDRLASIKLSDDFLKSPDNATAVKAQKKGQITARLRSYLNSLK